MPEIRIRYQDDSERVPTRAVAEILQAAAEWLPVRGVDWVSDGDLAKAAADRPDATESSEDGWWRHADAESRRDV